MLERSGRWAARHHRWVVAGWLVLLAGVWALGLGLGAKPVNDFSLPGAQSQEALDLLEENFPAALGTSATVVYHTTEGSNVETDADVRSTIEDSISALGNLAHVSSVTSPYDVNELISSDGTTALASVQYRREAQDLPGEGRTTYDHLENSVDRFRTGSLEIELGGALPGEQPLPIEPALVLYGLIAALIVLAIALATWWSFAWPVVGALVGVGLGVGFIQILQNVVEVPTISDTAAVMVGLGVGIDYGLFIMGRAKEYIEHGDEPVDAAARSLATVGHAVVTAGVTVVVALVALLVFEVPAVTAMAYAVVVVVCSVVLSALTLQPAIIGAVGKRIATSKVPWARRKDADAASPRRSAGQRWTNFVVRRAPFTLAAAMVLLVVLAIPVFAGDLRLGPLDNSLYPESSTQYKAWELQSQAFGPGSTDPFLVVVEIPSDDTDATTQVTTLIEDVDSAKGVAQVTPPQFDSDRSIAVFEVIPTTGAQDEATAELVDRLRDHTLPRATEGTDLTALVTGTNAVFVDLDDRIADRLSLFIGIVVLIALVVLGAAFRSVAIPIKAAVLNVLTILAAYGVIVAFFTYGWGNSLIGVSQDIPVLSLLAPIFFALLFGLSNDYEVYLVSRMREERDGGAGAIDAVRRGIGGGSRTVVSAALIMIFVFVSYVGQPGAPVKQFGFGMTVAILLDAFVTRMTAVPAIMRIGGNRMWWPGSTRRPESSTTRAPSPDG